MDPADLEPLLRDKIRVDPSSGCWLWTAALNEAGYGMVQRKIEGQWRVRRVHRLVYAALVGDPGEMLDHLCRVRSCCNPAHLEPVDNGENVRRGVGPQRIREKWAAPRSCPSGHPLEGDNLYIGKSRDWINRLCMECRREAARKHYWKSRGLPVPEKKRKYSRRQPVQPPDS